MLWIKGRISIHVLWGGLALIFLQIGPDEFWWAMIAWVFSILPFHVNFHNANFSYQTEYLK